MSRRCPLLLAIVLGVGTLAIGLAAGAGDACAQGAGPTDASLLRPEIDGDPRNPPQFRRGTAARPQADTSRFGEIQSFDYQSAKGAGTTGFDSTNARNKKKGKAKGKTRSQPTSGSIAETPGQALERGPPRALPLNPPRIVRKRGASTDVPPPEAIFVASPSLGQPSRRAKVPEATPFDPLGIQIGAFLLRPAIEYTRGFDSNAPRTARPQPSWYTVYQSDLLVASNWARHALTGTMRGTYTTYDSDHSLDRPNLDSKVNGRVDVTSLTRIDLEGRLLMGTDAPGSPNIQADLARLPVYTTLGGSLGGGQIFNRLEVAVRGNFDRTTYEDSHFEDGQTESNVDRNYNQFGSQVRATYDLLPNARPFMEVNADSRQHDVQPDRFGYYRNSNGINGKVGTSFYFGPSLVGEVSVGYLTRSYQDPRLAELSGVLTDASVIWTASALTIAKLTVRTTASETTVPGVSGLFTREVTVQVDHAFRRWLVGTLKLTGWHDDYEGSPRIDMTYSASASMLYMMTRDWWLKGEYRREWRVSSEPDSGFLANVYLLGLRWQR